MISPIFHASRKLKLGGGGGEVCILDVVCMCCGTGGAGGGGGGHHPCCIIRVVGMAINLRKEKNSGSSGLVSSHYQSSLRHLAVMTVHSQVYATLIRIHGKIYARQHAVALIISWRIYCYLAKHFA